jgi:Fur family ferric uptake transcriptional regulator
LKRSGKNKETQEAIASIVRGLPKGTHLTAPEVFEKARALGLDVSLSTVYRNLHRLKAGGNVMTLAGERGLRYETAEDGPEHDHLICLGCNLTIEFVDDLIRGFGRTVAQRKGFDHHSSRFDILGYCSDCSAKDEAHRLEQASEMFGNAIQKLEETAAMLVQALDLNDTRKVAKAITFGETSVDKLNEAMIECQNALSLLARTPASRDS